MRILFVCLGNICRSPMAEAIALKMLDALPDGHGIEVDSAGMSSYHEGQRADSRMRSAAAERGYDIAHRSRPVVAADFRRFDLILGMDDDNMEDLRCVCPANATARIAKITDYITSLCVESVPDPYYGGPDGFKRTIDLLEEACRNLIQAVLKGRNS